MANTWLQQLSGLIGKEIKKSSLDMKDAVAELLKVSPAALDAFERAYSKQALTQEPEGFFDVNSRMASDEHQNTSADNAVEATEWVSVVVDRIVRELVAQTEVFIYDGKRTYTETLRALPQGYDMVTNADLSSIPLQLRPQLTGKLAKKDIEEPAYLSLLWYYQKSKTERNPKKRKDAYDHFRQGLDILDLDAVTYEIIGTNPNSMGHWLPALITASAGKDFFRIPVTTIAKVPQTLLQLTRLDYMGLTRTTLDIVDAWARETFSLDINKEYFIKTGTYSSKFDFRNCHVHGAKEIRELGEYLLFIHFQALQMASPLCTPCIYGVSTTNEWVVREFIPDKENNPCIYKGLPLHTEYRVFVDCDTDEILEISPYWEPETMKKRFGSGKDADSPHQVHDYIIYKAHEDTLMRRYHENKERVITHLSEILPDLDLQGQWSIDVMQNGNEFWLIDMAIAENSTFYDCVPENLRNPRDENWIPKLPIINE